MKKIILILLLFIPSVYALYGGETWSYYFNRCNYLTVNITGTLRIDEGEYTILNDCTRIQDNYWGCNCHDDYNFSVSFKPNAINNYSLEFDYLYSEETSEDAPRGAGGALGSGNSGGAFTIRFLSNHSRTLMLKQGVRSVFWMDGDMHTIMLVWVSNDTVGLEIRSEPILLILKKNEPAEFRIDNETLKMDLKEVRGRVVFITFSKAEKEEPTITPMGEPTPKIQEENTTEEKKIIEEPPEEQLEIPTKEEPSFIGLLVALFVMSVIGLSATILYIKARKKDDKT